MQTFRLLTAMLSAYLAIAAPVATPAKASGRLFSLNGQVTYFAGTNAWWLGYLTLDSDVNTVMQELSQSDERIVRVWGFGNSNTNDSSSVYYQLIDSSLPGNKTAINYDTNGIARLDSVVSAAEKSGIQLVLPLLNNWNDLGGINTYCAVFACNATSFYTNAAAQAAYKNYIAFIVNRYKASSAIFAWELMNEPRCNGCDSSVIYNWASETSRYIKSLDATHMVTLGDEGWLCSGGDGSYAYSCAEGVDFEKNLGIDTLDYGTFHLYPDAWGYNETWGNTWIQEHDAIGKAANKPVVLEEYGAAVNMVASEQAWQETVLNSTEIAADQFWQFPSANTQSGSSAGDAFSLQYGSADYTTLATDHAKAMLAKDVSGSYD